MKNTGLNIADSPSKMLRDICALIGLLGYVLIAPGYINALSMHTSANVCAFLVVLFSGDAINRATLEKNPLAPFSRHIYLLMVLAIIAFAILPTTQSGWFGSIVDARLTEYLDAGITPMLLQGGKYLLIFASSLLSLGAIMVRPKSKLTVIFQALLTIAAVVVLYNP